MNAPAQTKTDLGRYTLIAFALSWVLVTPIGASHQGRVGATFSSDWHFLGAIGPLTAALAIGRSEQARRFLSAGWVQWRVSPWFYLAALSPLLFLAPSALVVRLQEGAWPNLGALADYDLNRSAPGSDS